MKAPVRKRLLISNVLGLHARAAATLVQVTSRFNSKIQISRTGEEWVDGKSILSMMTLAAAKGTELLVSCEGDDQLRALQAIEVCVQNKFGEEV